MSGHTLRVAAIGGDGIGPEVVDASLPVIVEAAALAGTHLKLTELDWGGERLLRTGSGMPEDAVDIVREHDAVLLGAVGHPELAPEVSLWSLVLPLRKALDLYVNLRPIRAMDGAPTPLADPGGVDFQVVRENTEGEYAGIGGRTHTGTPDELATDVVVHTRRAITRLARYAFRLADSRGEALTLVTKSNASPHGYGLWDDVLGEIAEVEFPDVGYEKCFVDAMATRMMQRPRSLGVLLCSNLFGDILSDLGAVIQGGLGMVQSANLGRDGTPGIFESVHGSAPDIIGKGIANPIATLLSGALLLRENGCRDGADRLEAAVCAAILQEEGRTPDLGGSSDTKAVARTVWAALNEGAPRSPAKSV